MKMEKEIRKIQLRANNSENRTIDGYASVFDSLSEDLGGFRELVDKNAFAGVIEKSDVFALLNHNSDRGILARSKQGTGTLSLSIDGKGLHYSFESPATALGDEAIEMIKRGDIDSSSFAFTVESDKWDKQADGTYIRTILKFGQLFDISPVYQPAYQSTTACKRFLEIQEENKEIPVEIVEHVIEQVTEEQTVEVAEESTEQAEEQPVESTDESIDEVIEENEHVIESTDEERNNEKNDVQTETRDLNIDKNKITKNKEKRQMEDFKLISVIAKKAGVDKREMTQFEQDVLTRCSENYSKTGLQKTTIQLPIGEMRDITATGVGAGIENVGETKLNILEPLRANLSLVSAGAQILSNLVGDVSIPNYAGSNVAWKGETVAATDGAGEWGEVILKPKRLTASIAISNQFLAQDSNDAEGMLQRDIMNAISEKLEQTILGNGAKSDTMPAGVFAGVTGSTAATYASVTALEAALEDLNVKNYSFIVNPKAKFAYKGTKINEGKMVFDGNTIDGIPAYSTSAVYGKGVICADFRDLVIGILGDWFNCWPLYIII